MRLSPYDTGEVLEPHAWTSEEGIGRVDFDDEESTTIMTVRVERAAEGYRVIITPLGDDQVEATIENL